MLVEASCIVVITVFSVDAMYDVVIISVETPWEITSEDIVLVLSTEVMSVVSTIAVDVVVISVDKIVDVLLFMDTGIIGLFFLERVNRTTKTVTATIMIIMANTAIAIFKIGPIVLCRIMTY